MKPAIRSKRLMLLLMVLSVASFSFYSKLELQLVAQKSALKSASVQLDKEKKFLARIDEGLGSSKIVEGRVDPLHQMQMRFLYRVQELAVLHGLNIVKLDLNSKNLDSEFIEIAGFPGIKGLPILFNVSTTDYEKTKSFFDVLKKEFPIRLEAIQIRYPSISTRFVLLGNEA